MKFKKISEKVFNPPIKYISDCGLFASNDGEFCIIEVSTKYTNNKKHYLEIIGDYNHNLGTCGCCLPDEKLIGMLIYKVEKYQIIMED